MKPVVWSEKAGHAPRSTPLHPSHFSYSLVPCRAFSGVGYWSLYGPLKKRYTHFRTFSIFLVLIIARKMFRKCSRDFLVFFRRPGLSKDKQCWFWGLWARPKIQKSCKLRFWAFKIMKSGFCYTKMKRNKSIKLFKILFKYIFTILGPKMAIIITILFPMILL